MALEPGIAKIKLGGGHAGHNGLKDIASKFGNNPNFYRLRLGIGHPGHKDKVTGYVLGKAPQAEQSFSTIRLMKVYAVSNCGNSKGWSKPNIAYILLMLLAPLPK